MTYIPVGTLLTYTAQFQGKASFISGLVFTWEDLAAKLKSDLPNLQGAEELDVESSNGSNVILSGTNSLSLQILNNGVDHASETDIQAIIDGVIQGYGVNLISSSITSITLPNNPGDDVNQGQTISTGAISNAPVPSSPSSSGFNFSSLLPSTSTKLLTTGTIIIIAIVALILLMPSGFGKALRAVR